MTNAQLSLCYKALDALYAELPQIKCKGDCHTTCGPIPVSPVEEMRLRSTARTIHEDGISCGLLGRDNRCKAYDKRPTVCRLFGVVDSPDMRCPYGCIPERYMTRKESYEFTYRVLLVSNAINAYREVILP